jgi:hypothetical protein
MSESPEVRNHVEHEIEPSPWPFVTAGGMSLLLFGMATTYAFSVLGLLIMALGIARWIGDMRRA